MERQYNHYFKPCPYNEIDLYRVARILNINENELFHAFKKIVAAGKRGAKSNTVDIIEAVDSLVRWLEMRVEDAELNINPLPDHKIIVEGKLRQTSTHLQHVLNRVAALPARYTEKTSEISESNASTGRDNTVTAVTLQANAEPPLKTPQQDSGGMDDIIDSGHQKDLESFWIDENNGVKNLKTYS